MFQPNLLSLFVMPRFSRNYQSLLLNLPSGVLHQKNLFLLWRIWQIKKSFVQRWCCQGRKLCRLFFLASIQEVAHFILGYWSLWVDRLIHRFLHWVNASLYWFASECLILALPVLCLLRFLVTRLTLSIPPPVSTYHKIVTVYWCQQYSLFTWLCQKKCSILRVTERSNLWHGTD